MNKENDKINQIFENSTIEFIALIWSEWRKQKLPLAIFISFCLNLLIAPVVYAISDGTLERRSAWAIGVLGLVACSLVIYLFFVIFQPERF